MMFVCSNRTIYVQPLFAVLLHQDDLYFPLRFSLECLLIFISFLLSWYFVYLLFFIRIVHKNLNLIMASIGILVTESAVANGLIMVDVWRGEAGSCSWRLEVASMFLIFYCCFIIHTSLASLIERFCALYYLKDYERKSRLEIPVAMLVVLSFISILASYLVYSKIFETIYYVLYLMVVVLICIPFYFLLWRLNYVLLKRLENNPKLTRNMVVGFVLAGIIIGLLVLFTGNNQEHADEKYLPSQLAMSHIIIIIVAIFSSKKWKSFTMRRLPWGHREKIVGQPPKASHGQIYFNQLEKSWDPQI